MGGQQRHPVESEGPLFVIGAGLGRTGTMSAKTALEILYGQPCYHMGEIVLKHRDHMQRWLDLYQWVEGNPSKPLPVDKVHEIFKGYRTSIANPACVIYRQLMEVYPEAKIILTIRDSHAWVESVRATIIPRRRNIFQMLYHRFRLEMLAGWGFHRLATKTMQLALGNDIKDDDEKLREAFERWNNSVKNTVPPERLLVFDVNEGWEPLCRFLGIDVPSVPFPKVNDRETFKARINAATAKSSLLFWIKAGLFGTAVAFGTYYICNRYDIHPTAWNLKSYFCSIK